MTKQTPLRLFIWGIHGKMGKSIVEEALKDSSSFLVVGGKDKEGFFEFENNALKRSKSTFEKLIQNSDLILDFSFAQANSELLELLQKIKIPKKQLLKILIGTTGINKKTLDEWQNFASKPGVSVLLAPNTSIGILGIYKILPQLEKLLSSVGFDVEMTEIHHKHKKDAPSGTALLLASACKTKEGKLPIHSLRGGGAPGEHRLVFVGEFEQVEIKHLVFSRKVFARGALNLAKKLNSKKPGFYTLDDV